ncbi:MAG: hypothetical protein R3349_09805, partial [Geminicoccaceae bacterium]|nr:hypothetical protein [Geminicoccaceae bacterium]
TLSPFYIVGLDVSPDFARDSTVAMTYLLWGFYLSEDAGATWEAHNDGVMDYPRGNGLSRLFAPVFSPDFASDRTIFTSTWYRILKSTDAGDHWRQILPVDEAWWDSSPNHHGMSLVLSPDYEDDGVVFMGTHRGRVFRSDDGGETFRRLDDVAGAVGSLAISPAFARDQTIFVGDTRGVRRSEDGGATWTFSALIEPELYQEFELSPFYDGALRAAWLEQQSGGRDKSLAIKLAISPAFANDGVVFAGTANGLFRSADGGFGWQQVRAAPFDHRGYVEAVAVSPAFARDGTVLVSIRGEGTFRSRDGGTTFHEVAHELIREHNPPTQYIGFTPKFPAIVFSPDFAEDQTVFAFSGTTLLRSTDGGEHFEVLDTPDERWIDRAHVWAAYYIQRPIERTLRSPRRLAALALVLVVAAAVAVFAVRRRWHRLAFE